MLSVQQGRGVLEDPRIADGAAGDPYDVDAGLLKHPHRILRREHVAAAENCLAWVARLHLPQKLPAAGAEVLLLDSAGMDADGCVAVRPDRVDDAIEAFD